MTKLSMHEDLPFDETTTPPRVSTGDLPMHAEIRQIVTAADQLYQTRDGEVADDIPALAKASPDLFGIAVVGPGSGLQTGDAATHFRSRASPSLSCSPWCATASAMRVSTPARCQQHRTPLRLGHGRRAQRPQGTMNPMVNAGAIATTSLVPGCVR